ncbi:MAG: right-handed parallel beta-helix repeat-containing protein [Anaerolineales bacterium]|nr:right-handed parallel beta-helix repeat-containing protein [Anaerolineales bacterium]
MNTKFIWIRFMFGCLLLSLLSSCATTPPKSLIPEPTVIPTPSPTQFLVPEDYPTIQQAIDAAKDGDDVIVSPGSYKENIDFKGKDITVRSIDPEDGIVVKTTIIDGGEKGSVVTFQSGETREARLVGFTITNGSGSEIAIFNEETIIIAGGGILITGGASPTIEGNTIGRNHSQAGGGIAVFSGTSPIIVGNTINNNDGDFGGGGIIVGEDSSPIIQENTIKDNVGKYGGGIDVILVSSVQIVGNSFSGNRADYGGGVYVTNESTVTITANTFSNNESWSGGAIRVESDSVLVRNDPDDNVYQNNQPEDVYYHGELKEEEAEFEGLDMIGLEADDTAINQMIANLLDNAPLDPCPLIHGVEAVSGTINPTYLVYISAAPEDFFLVVIHTINSDSEPYGSALFGTILEGESGNVIVTAEYPVPEGQTAPSEFEIQVVVPGCETFTETVSYGDVAAADYFDVQGDGITFRDDFNGGLDKIWQWTHENKNAWSLSNNPGWLDIMSAAGNMFLGTVENLLLRPAPDGDFEIETRLKFQPTNNYQLAGLVIYESDANNVHFNRGFCDAPYPTCVDDGYYIIMATGGEENPEYYPVSAPDNDTVWLRFRREGNTFTAYASEDGANWQIIGTHRGEIDPKFVGLFSASGYSNQPHKAIPILAQFDTFSIRDLSD